MNWEHHTCRGDAPPIATLIPDIVEAIVEDHEPRGISLNRLTEALPMTWEGQREVMGFNLPQTV